MLNLFSRKKHTTVGNGKAMPLTTMVKVPGGWKRLGDLKIGDSVIGPNGNTANVIGYTPQGITEVYRFHFEDDRIADSHPLHLWQVTETECNEEVCIREAYVTTTQDIVNHFGQFKYSIPLVGEVGGVNSQSTTDLKAAALTLLDPHVVTDDIVMELPYNDRFGIVKAMLEYSGCHVGENSIAFLSDHQTTATNFQDLIYSIGGTSVIEARESRYFNYFKHRDMVELVDGLVLDNLSSITDLSQYRNLRLHIRSVYKIDPQETACINIDSDDNLYVIDDYVVTHNSFT